MCSYGPIAVYMFIEFPCYSLFPSTFSSSTLMSMLYPYGIIRLISVYTIYSMRKVNKNACKQEKVKRIKKNISKAL